LLRFRLLIARVWARSISSGRVCIGRRTGRCSSTSCRTIGCTWACIRLILPNAKIIDARRHPLGCCFSNFKQHFAKGQAFSYSLEDMGRYYRDYVRLMAHLDRVQPGAVHRVVYERMVDDTEAEVRALLDYCGVEFEAACLAFHQTERAIRTPSSEQVRQPIFRDGTEAWKPYAEYLGPLRAALGEVLECYPQAPAAW